MLNYVNTLFILLQSKYFVINFAVQKHNALSIYFVLCLCYKSKYFIKALQLQIYNKK